MNETIIKVEGLRKRYVLSHQSGEKRQGYRRFSDVILGAARVPLGWLRRSQRQKLSSDSREDFWALDDVSFEIKRGDVVGIIGRNGAGKSTLLKILSRITEPTSGQIEIDGRVASLLEVGTGFHPELTGRENIFLNGAILGMRRVEMKKKFDNIVAFAEVERFLDTPVKHYSSGMYVRLAFAVAAHLEPEILIVDEVLAVGDAQFQKKCLGKMQDIAKQDGRTVIFVSHNMGVVANLCTRAILLKGGRVLRDGPVAEVVGSYIETGATITGEVRWTGDNRGAGNERMRLWRARIISGEKVTGDVLIDADVTLEFDYEILCKRCDATSSIHLFDKQGVWVLCSGPVSENLAPGLYRHVVTIPANFLNDGFYSVSIILLRNVTQIEVHLRDALTFCVHETGTGRAEYGGVINGCVRPRLSWSNALPQSSHE